MKQLLLAAIFLLPTLFTFGEEHVIELASIPESGWNIISDGYSVPDPEPGFKIVEYVTRWREQGSAAGFRLPFPETYQSAYYILEFKEPYEYPDALHLHRISLEAYGLNSKMLVTLLIEDNQGKKQEIFIGDLEYEGWKEMSYSNPDWLVPIDGFKITGIMIYQKNEPLVIPADKVVYFNELSIELHYQNPLEYTPSDDDGMSLEDYADSLGDSE